MSLTYPKIILTTPTETVTFSGSAVIDASLLEETNPVSVEVPYNVLTFKVINTNVDFSMFSGSLLSERLPLMLYENIDGVDTFIGKFYLETFKNETEYEVSFTAIDIIGALASTDYDGGFWATPTTLENVLSDILSPLGILYTLDDSIKDTLIQGYNPSGNYRDALQQVCFAAMATASSARSDRLVISPKSLPVGPYTKKIHNCEKLTSQPIELLPIVTKIELISHDYTQSTAQITDIFSQYLEAGSHKIVFDQPYYNIVIDGPGYTPSLLITENDDFIVTENDDYIEVGGQYTIDSNAIYLEMQEAGTVTVTGYAYTDNKKSHIFNETGITNYSNKKTLQISNATMVGIDIAETILNNLRDYYRQRYQQVLTLLPNDVETKDILLSGTFFAKQILGSVTKMTLKLTGGFLLETTILGIEPVYIEPETHPTRRARTGVAICGSDLTYNNKWREYA